MHTLLSQVFGETQQVVPHSEPVSQQPLASLAHLLVLLGQVKMHTHLSLLVHILVSVPHGLGSVGQQLLVVSGMHLSPQAFSSEQQPDEMQAPLLQRRWPAQQVVLGTQLLSAHLVSSLQQVPAGRQTPPAQLCGWLAGQAQ